MSVGPAARRILPLLAVSFLWFNAGSLLAQDILLDEFEKIGNLMIFRSYDNSRVYFYLPNHPRLAVSEKGEPEFSFLKYVRTIRPSADRDAAGGIREAAGGGVVHFLVTYQVSDDEIRNAEVKLRKKVKEARIAGPVIFRSGTFGLVTSLKDEQGGLARRVVGLGRTPLLEGNRAAVSMDLTEKGASLLWESFQMANPDISLVFEMEFMGYRKPYQATLEADWSQVFRNREIRAGIKVLWVGADIDMAFKKLEQEGAVTITAKGESPNMEALLAKAHARLLEIMFEKTEPERKTEEEPRAGGFLEAVGSILSGKWDAAKWKSGFSLFGGYRLKNISQSGKLVMDLNNYSPERLTTVIAGNIGDLYRQYGEDPRFFKAANLDDPVYNQREIHVMLDGRSQGEFENYINFVTVQLLKEHRNGSQSVDEVVIDRQSFAAQKNQFRMAYGWKEDHDRLQWMKYKYKAVWNFLGGASYDTGWQETDSFVLSVTPPYQYRRISVEADPDVFAERGVRHALVRVYYDFFGRQMTAQETLKTKDGVLSKVIEYSCPAGKSDFAYEIVWYMQDGSQIRSSRKTETGDILYADEIPVR